MIELSIDYTKTPEYHYELAKKLTSLRDKGVLIIGSGNIMHNLRLVDFKHINTDNYGFDWAIEAHAILNEHLLKGDDSSLIAYNKLPAAVQIAIPTPDHYLPLIYSLALRKKEETLSLFNDKLVGGSLSMTSLKIE